MWIRTSWFSAFLLEALVPGRPALSEPSAPDVLAAMKAATGGSAWDKVSALHLVSTLQQGGLSGTQDERDDVLTGRYSTASALGPTTQRDGYDGARAWNQDDSGQSRYVAAADDVAAAKSAAYRDSFSYWFPSRRLGTVTYLRHADEGGRGFDVLQAAPSGGRPFQMWVDASTHRLDRIVEAGAEETATTFFSDYRTVGGLLFPFKARTSTGDPRYDAVVEMQAVVVNEPVPASTFALPPPPPPDYTIVGDAASVTVPFRYEGDHVFVDIKINGQGPFSAVLDTGGTYVATPALAGRVGLKAQGTLPGNGNGALTVDTGLARAETVSIGGLTLRRPLFVVLPLPGLRDRPIVGYELFKRFVTRIDYDAKLLTFTRPDRFAYKGQGVSVPFRFNDTIPEVDGSVDGVPGAFTIDTGAGGNVRLNRPFVEAHGLTDRYRPRIETIIGYGVGGPERGGVVRLGRLALGGVGVRQVVAALASDRAGGGADKVVAGNVGEGLLHRFNLTFDYARMRIIFEPNSYYADPDSQNRTGINVDPNAPNALVADVVPGSPAALAGIKIADVIESVDGQGMPKSAFSPLLDPFRQPAGTRLRLRVRTGQATRTVTLVLRDLV